MKKTVRLICIACLFAILSGCFAAFPVSASGSVYADLNATDVTEDLTQLGFDLAKYPIDETINAGQTDRFLVLMQVLEFGYDYFQKDFSDYGLFLYFYNPSGTDLTGTLKNTVQIALKTASGTIGDYNKHAIMRCSVSSDHRFYKYRVTGMTATLLRSLNKNFRTYCISGVEMQFAGDQDPTDFEIGGTYTFSGHQQGYGFNKSMGDSLYCTYRKLETLNLDLHPASWRSDYQSEKGENWRTEISSVYFAIPNWYFKQYGNPDDETKGLYSARVQYYENYVNGIVSDNAEMINYLQERNDSRLSPFVPEDAFSAYVTERARPDEYSQMYDGFSFVTYRDLYFRYGLNVKNPFYESTLVESGEVWRYNAETVLPRVGISFYSSSYDNISAEAFAARYNNVEAVAEPGKIVSYIPEGGYSSHWSYQRVVPEGRTLGWHTETLTRDELLKYSDTSEWNANTNGFSKWFYRLFHKDESAMATEQTVSVIETVDVTDAAAMIAFKNEVSAKKHYVSEADIPNLISYVVSEELNPLNWTNGVFGSTVVLLHFAATDFYSAELQCFRAYDGMAENAAKYTGNHYYFEKSYFEDFDVLSLTFVDEGGNVVTLPVVADPTDVGGDLPSPYEGATGKDPSTAPGNQTPGWWDTFTNFFGSLRGWIQVVAIILGIFALLLLLGVFTPIFKPFFNVLGRLFSGFFSLLGSTGRTIKSLFDFRDDRYEARRRRQEDKQRDEDRDFGNAEKKYDSERKRVTDRQKDEDRSSGNAEQDLERSRRARRWDTEQMDLEIRDRKNKKQLATLKKQEETEQQKQREARKEKKNLKKARQSLDDQERALLRKKKKGEDGK